MECQEIKTGVVSEFNGMYWGIQRSDGNSTTYGYGLIDKAIISNEALCKKPTDMPSSTWNTDQAAFEKLSMATLKKVTITTTYKVESPPTHIV